MEKTIFFSRCLAISSIWIKEFYLHFGIKSSNQMLTKEATVCRKYKKPFDKIDDLKNFAKFTGKFMCWILFSITLEAGGIGVFLCIMWKCYKHLFTEQFQPTVLGLLLWMARLLEMNISLLFYEQYSYWKGIIATVHVATVTSDQVSVRILFFVYSDLGHILTSNIHISN